MVTLTFGSGGAYADFPTAFAAATWNDDHLFLQVGAASHASSWYDVQRNGYTAIIKGNGDTYTISTTSCAFRFTNIAATGDFIMEDLVFSHSSNSLESVILLSTNTGVTTSFSFVFRRNRGSVKYVDFVFGGDSNFNILDFYANDISMNTDWFNNLGRTFRFNSAVHPTAFINIEDNKINRVGTAAPAQTVFYSAAPTQMRVKRNYVHGNWSTDALFTDATSRTIDGGAADTYCSFSDQYITATHDDILFTTDNFISIGESDPLFAVPKEGSPVYDDATQTSNITDNVVGLNGIPVSYRSAGAYTSPIQINPPTGLAAEYTGTGVKLTWTDYAPVQVGYEKVNVFYEIVSVESAFTTAKATVDGGVEEYTISYAELTTFPIWYVRLSHGA